MHPFFNDAKLHKGGKTKKAQQHHGQRCAVARIPEFEAGFVNVVEQQRGSVVGAALRKHKEVIHHAKSVDGGVDKHKKRCGHEQGNDHAAVIISARSPFKHGRFPKAGWDLLQCREVKDHKKSRILPYCNTDHAEQGGLLAAKPVNARARAQKKAQLLKQAVIGRVKKQPDVGHGDHWQHCGYKVAQPQKCLPLQPRIDQKGHEHGQRHGAGDGAAGKDDVVAQRFEENLVVQQIAVLLKPYELGRRSTPAIHKKTVDKRAHRRIVRKRHHQGKAGEQKQPCVDLPHGFGFEHRAALLRLIESKELPEGQSPLAAQCLFTSGSGAECGQLHAGHP